MRRRPADQYTLFDIGTSLPNGFVYRPEFLSAAEEEALLAWFLTLPLKRAPHGEYLAQRRIKSFGWAYEDKRFIPGPPLPPELSGIARRAAKWTDTPVKEIVEALVTEYTPGAGVGWHKDNEPCKTVIGVSLGGWADMQLRPLPRYGDPKEITRLSLEPRSAYLMQNDSRYRYQHRIMPVSTQRYSITFRTLN